MPQLYAEAINARAKGEQHWLPADIEAIASEEQAERESQDPWWDQVAELVEAKKHEAQADREMFGWVRSVEVLRKIGLPAEKQDRAAEMRAAELLKKLGGKSRKLPRKMGHGMQGYRFDLELGGQYGQRGQSA
jgi:predicted P-loop ATPase